MQVVKPTAALGLLIALLAGCAPQSLSTQSQVPAPIERGKYLVAIMGCSDCHTPGGLSPKPDMTRYLGGSDVDFNLAGIGVFAPPNLTPDNATGLGSWTTEQIVTAITTGVRPDGRVLAPAMPWADFAHLTKGDAEAVAAYLKSIPPVTHKAPGPRPPQPCVEGAVQCLVQRPGG